MIADLQSYAATRDSGVRWLGDIPEHWDVRRVRSIGSILNGATPSSHESEYWNGRIVWITPEDLGELKGRYIVSSARRISESGYQSCGTKLAPPGSLAISTRAPIGHLGILDVEGCVNQGCRLIVPRDGLQPEFLYYQISSARQHLEALGQGSTFTELSRGKLATFPLAIPPFSEQGDIVRFLDYADRLISRYIRAKRALIELLEEQKQVIIHRAVTRGLDPDVRLKPSGVEWLWDLPEYWEVRPAKWFFREVDERSVDGDEELLSVSHLTGVTPRSQKNITMFMAESYAGHKLCRPGDLVINTMWAWMGALGVSRHTGIVSPSYGVYRPHRDSPLLGDYADVLLRTRPYVSEYICRSTGIRSSRLRLYPERFLRIAVVCPPSEEQQRILARLRAETAETTRAVELALREIALLSEYRTRLIADVVTGKLDVREALARLPEGAQESESHDEAAVLTDAEASTADDLVAELEEAEA